jgi:ribonuclease-3
MRDDNWRIHPSYRKNLEFQRLEFLGDKLLAAELSKILFENEGYLTEGEMSLAISILGNKNTLAKISEKTIGSKIKYTGPLTKKILSSTLEAWLAFQYLKGKDIGEIIRNLWKESLNKKFHKSPKNLLQEFAQEKKIPLTYTYESSNNKHKAIVLFANEKVEAFGTSKKVASENAAKLVLNLIRTN